MASVTARLCVLGESGYGEKEQDANSALTELDKGLRSGKSGEQCEAIVRFPRLFEKYPFPILINSAFLKLGDVFRVGNNFLRLCVLKVTQQSHKHLDKILNLDEFVKRIYAVIHSNDPLARALTLRTLGSIACSIPEKKNVHHIIRNSLDTHDAVELEAAIYATEKFASYSKTFASNICGKIVQMIEGLETPVDMKLRLIPIFQHMHIDVSLATMVRNLCTDLLPTCPAQKMVLVTLNTITKLTAAALINVPEHISLLFLYLNTDPRHAVKISSLNNLRFLAERLPHIWSEDNINNISNFALESPYKPLKYLSLDLLVTLAKTVAVQQFDVLSGSQLLTLCETLAYSDDATIAAKAIELQSQLALHSYKEGHLEGDFDIFHEAIMAIESLLLMISSKPCDRISKVALKMGLSCAVSLCEADSNVGHQFVESIGSLVGTTTGETTVLLCEALAAIANRKNGVLSPLFYSLMKSLTNVIEKNGDSHSKQDKQSIVMLYILLFQTSKDNVSMVKELEPVVCNTTVSCDPWMCYKIGRQAARYGHHNTAARIFLDLTNKVCSEHLHFWLIGLWELSSGESKLCSSSLSSGPTDYIDRLSDCVSHYLRGLSALRAATTPSHNLQFQCEYARLRSEMINAHAQLFHVCNCYKLSPPPAIAAALAVITRDELDRCGRIATQLRKSVKEFRSVGEMYGKLCQTHFDMDPLTLTNILILQQSCYLMAHAIETIALKSQNLGFINSEDEVAFDISLGLPKQYFLQSIEIQGMVNANRRAFSIIQEILLQSVNKLIAHEHIQAIIEMSQILTEVSLCYPRFFFQSLQSTNIKLAISPQPRTVGEPILVQNGAHLALKVEGIVQHVSRSRKFRSVKSIVITVTYQPQIRPAIGFESKVNLDSFNTTMSRTVEPHNDYFSAQFLLAFSVIGIHVIVVEVAILDDKGELWTTGPRSVLTAKFYDDPGNQKAHTINRPGVSGRF